MFNKLCVTHDFAFFVFSCDMFFCFFTSYLFIYSYVRFGTTNCFIPTLYWKPKRHRLNLNKPNLYSRVSPQKCPSAWCGLLHRLKPYISSNSLMGKLTYYETNSQTNFYSSLCKKSYSRNPVFLKCVVPAK